MLNRLPPVPGQTSVGQKSYTLLPRCTASPHFPQVHHPPTSNRQVMDSHRCFRNQGDLGATLYVTRNDHLHLAGFFSAKPRKHQVIWLPCEIEALCIAAAVKHFSPFIIQSKHHACVLKDSKPCVQAITKLCIEANAPLVHV